MSGPSTQARTAPQRRASDAEPVVAATSEARTPGEKVPSGPGLNIPAMLLQEGFVTAEQIAKAHARQKTNGHKLGYNLIELGFVESATITRMLERQYRVAGVDLSTTTVEPSVLKLIPAEIAQKYEVFPVRREGSTIVLAMGVEWRRLEVDPVDRFVGSGVYYGAARSDAGLAQGNEVYLIGAGNSAGQAAIFFSNHARSVTLLVRGESLAASMSHYLIEQMDTKANIRVETRSEVVAVHGDDQLEAIEVIDRRAGTTSRRDTRALFVLMGAEAATGWLPAEIARDEHGFVLTGTDAMRAGHWTTDREPFALETSAPGIFAVGDIRSGSVKRVAAAVGEGGMSIAFVHRCLQVSS